MGFCAHRVRHSPCRTFSFQKLSPIFIHATKVIHHTLDTSWRRAESDRRVKVMRVGRLRACLVDASKMILIFARGIGSSAAASPLI